MNYFKRFFGHLRTVLEHKYWVFHYASRLGYPWRGLMHDLSKFSPIEFFEGVKYWSGKRSPILVAKETVGVSKAWLHHRGRNRHHYEYWIDRIHDRIVYHKIPFEYAVEMVCDWLAACRTYHKTGQETFNEEFTWWENRRKHIRINKRTKELVSKMLWNLKEFSENYDEDYALDAVRNFLTYWEEEYNGEINEEKD